MRSTRAPLLCSFLVMLASCKESPRAAARPDTTAVAAPQPVTAACLAVSPDMVRAIRAGVKGVGSQQPVADISHVFAIRDPKGPLYYISGTVVSQAGGAPYVMTWASQSLEAGQGIIFAVTPGARAVTLFPDALPTVQPDNTSGAAVGSRQCVMKATGVTKGL